VALGLAAVLVVLIAAVAVVGLGTKPSGDASPSGTAAAVLRSASPSPTPEPKPTVSLPAASPTPTRPPAARFAHDSFVTVATSDLRVRTKPGVGPESVKLEPLLSRGAVAFVLDGPVPASGYDWYLVAPLGEVDLQTEPDPPRLGWVASASNKAEPWLKKTTFPCAPNPLGFVPESFDWPPSGYVALSCLGSKPQTFVAGIGPVVDGCDFPLRITPPQFDHCAPASILVDPSWLAGDERSLSVILDPGVDVAGLSTLRPGSFLKVNVTGQYDHPAARTCRTASGPQHSPPELVVLDCRSRFVVTSLAVVADP